MIDFIPYKTVTIPKQQISNLFSNTIQFPTIESTETTTEAPSSTTDETTISTGFKWGSSRTATVTPTVTEETSTSSAPSSKAAGAISFAYSKIGDNYQYAKAGENGKYDCSGLIYAAYKSQGVEVPRSTEGWISGNKTKVDSAEGQPGDVIITKGSGPSGRHAMLITENLGGGKYSCIAARSKSKGITETTYTVGNGLKGIYRAKQGAKLVKQLNYGS